MSSSSSSSEINDSPSVRPRRKRCNHPKATTDYLIRWVVDHIVEPYPTEEEKTSLSQEVNLTPKQLEDWFTNLRRRKLEKIRIAMGIDPYIDSQRTPSRKGIKGRYSPRQSENYERPHIEPQTATKRHCTSNTYLENDRTPIIKATCSNQPGVTILKRTNSLSSLSESSSDMNTTPSDTNTDPKNDSNLRLLCWVALNYS